MGNITERIRTEIIDSRSALSHHSINQRQIKFQHEGVRRRMKAVESLSKKREKQRRQLEKKVIAELPFSQTIFDISLVGLRNGEATPFESQYVETHLDDLELIAS